MMAPLHEAAIQVLEDHVVTLDLLSKPTRHTITQFSADQHKAEAVELRKTIELLRSLKDTP